MTTTRTPATSTDEPAGPCGCFACDKWADCAYCGNCTANDPRAAHDADQREQQAWNREHHGSLSDWLYDANDGMHTCPTCGRQENSALPCPTALRVPTNTLIRH